MRVARLDVDEGFLDGLSVEFDQGLNVLIGARGVGKTSVIELLRFVLGGPWFTADAQSRSLEQVKAVLGGGLARVTLTDGQSEVVVVRSLRDEVPRANGPIPSVTVLAQNEIEAVGAQPHGRLGLVDRFRSTAEVDAEGQRLALELRSLGGECHELLRAIDLLEGRVDEFSEVAEILAAAEEEQRSALDGVAATTEDQQQLAGLQQLSTRLAAQKEVLEAARSAVVLTARGLANAETATGELPSWPSSAGDVDLLLEPRQLLRDAVGHVAAARGSLDAAGARITSSLVELESQQVAVDEQARGLRSRLDGLRAGLGQITKRVDELRERLGQSEALRQQLQEARARLSQTASRRRQAFVDLERVRTHRFESRVAVADWLSQELAPTVRVTVSRSAARQAYAGALADVLKGSGLHYNRLAPQVAAALSPLELVELVESGDAAKVGELVDIPIDRARNLVSYLYSCDLSSVLIAPIDDAADLWLMDGVDYKSAANLSIGQRCTSVLPILLRSRSDILIVDQPEDHLDNAFITGTLVTSLRGRSPDAQFIFASHNANIPVLGEADRIVHLDSDGRRGFVRHQGPLDDPRSVKAVTDVMEGGAAAFQRRAAFYASHQ